MEEKKNIASSSKKSKKTLIIIIVSVLTAVIVAVVISLLILHSSKDSDDDYDYNDSYYNETEKPQKELTESEKMIAELYKLLDEKLVFDTGNYIEGEIPEGEYAFVKMSEGSGYYEEDDASGEIIDNENFSSFGYVKVHGVGNLETRGVLINVSAFERLGVSGAKEIYEKLNNKSDWNQSGYYKVGFDIEPGKYILESIGNGYWSILTGPVSSNDIVSNDNFNGKATVNLKNGQYLELNRAKVTKAE